MSGQHSIIEHRANYFFLKIEEDYVTLFKGDKHQHCKAAILSILEHWTNTKRAEGITEEDVAIYLSYPQFVKQMFGLFGRSTVIHSISQLVLAKLIWSRPYTDSFNQKTFAYRLNIPLINERLRNLEDKPLGSVNPNGGSVKVNYPPSKNTLPGSVEVNGGSSKSKRNLDYIDSNIDSTQITIEEGTGALTQTPPLSDNLISVDVFEARKSESEGRLKAVTPPPIIPSWDEVDADTATTKHRTPAIKPQGDAAPLAPTQQTVRGATGLPSLSQDGAAPPAFVGNPSPSANASQPRASGAQQAPLSLKDDAPRPLSEKTLRARYEANFWTVIEDVRKERGLKPPTYGKAWKALRENQEGINALYADGVSFEDIARGYKAMLDSSDAWLRNNFNVMAFFKRLQGLLDAKPTNGKAGKGKPSRTAYDGQTDLDTYGFGQNDEAQIEKYTKLGAAS